MSDLRAQLAACIRGAERLVETARDVGADVIAAYMGHVLANAEEAVRRLIDRLDDGAFDYSMDNGAIVRVAIKRRQGGAIGDVRLHRNQRPTCPTISTPRIRSSARRRSMSCVRLIDDAIPMNDGCLRPIRLIVPEGSMLSPAYPAAVVAGNVETSQVVTDALFAATGRLAPSQGTMNNLTFGSGEYQYYETIAGGSGAGPDHDGTDAVQTHMTNSRLTDPEILETRFPVRLERFAIRNGLGRRRRAPRRQWRCPRHPLPRADARQHPRQPPPHRAARDQGRRRRGCPGRNWIERADGRMEMLGRHRIGRGGSRRRLRDRDAGRRRLWEQGGMINYWPLLGIALVVLGFALKFNPMLVVTVSAIATGLIAGMDPVEVISTFGKAFNDNRIIAIVWIVLPVIGLLERFGLQQRAAALIRSLEERDHRAAADPLPPLSPDHRGDRAPFDRRATRRPCARWSRRWRLPRRKSSMAN